MEDVINHLVTSKELEKIFPKHCFAKLRPLVFPAGHLICRQGEPLEALFYMVRGKVKIVRRLFNGREHILDIKNKPTLIGNLELLTDQTIVSSVIALEETVMLALPIRQEKEELLKDPLFLLKLGQGLAHSLYRQNLKAATNLSYSTKEQLATHILAVEHQGNFQLELATLADSFGISYRHLLRVIHGFIKSGIISKNKPNYQIINRKQLQDWAVKD